jgi:hypothetical protein
MEMLQDLSEKKYGKNDFLKHKHTQSRKIFWFERFLISNRAL